MPKKKSGIGEWIDDLLGGDETSSHEERESRLSGEKGGTSRAGTDASHGWQHESGHHEAATEHSHGSKGGVASHARHPGHQLTEADRAKGGRNAQRSGHAHHLTEAERARGGRA